MGAQNIANLHEHRSDTQDQAGRELLQLQLEQFQHDEMYHREIARLTVQHRLSHMVLHLAKYVGAIASADIDSEKLDRAIVDGVIISLSTANILNLKLADKLIRNGASFPNLSALGLRAARTAGVDQFNRDWLLKKMAVGVGQMAKGCESIDHLEAFPFREAITEGLLEVLTALLVVMAVRGVNPSTAVRHRLMGVKEKSIFHGLV
jgi:hypothetical protein